MTRRARVQIWAASDFSTNAMTVHALLAQILDVERVVELFCLETDLSPQQITMTSQTSVRVFLLPLMMTVRAAFGPESEDFFRGLLLVSPMTGRTLKS